MRVHGYDPSDPDFWLRIAAASGRLAPEGGCTVVLREPITARAIELAQSISEKAIAADGNAGCGPPVQSPRRAARALALRTTTLTRWRPAVRPASASLCGSAGPPRRRAAGSRWKTRRATPTSQLTAFYRSRIIDTFPPTSGGPTRRNATQAFRWRRSLRRAAEHPTQHSSRWFGPGSCASIGRMPHKIY
jgi:hypothetical protein